ncbi:protein artichoke-like isoform X2 [Tigriopus californicus]|nr:protein artichoke-like isoform X2 [Tigriopus californicus]
MKCSKLYSSLIEHLLFFTCLVYKIHGSDCHTPGSGIAQGGEILRINPQIQERLKTFQGAGSKVISTRENKGSSEGDVEDTKSVVSFCPQKCQCNITLSNQLQVVCTDHFSNNFPIETLRKDVEILKIVPQCLNQAKDNCVERQQNHLNLGPNFKYLRLLKVLVITDSNIPNIGIRTLWGLSGLRILDLSRNKLTTIVDKNFDGLYSLKEIHFNNNQIKSMVSAAFRHVTQLELLSLRHNRIHDLAPRIFFKLRNLKHLDLSGNKLEHIDGGVFVDTPNLECFACEGCSLFQLNLPLHVELHQLGSLLLANNTFQSQSDINPKFLRNVQELDLSKNFLVALEPLESQALQILKVARNNITKISDCALCNTSIQHLNLGYNRMAYLNGKMFPENIKSLQSLTLSGNWVNLVSLEHMLHGLPTLESLDLDHTGIVNVPNGLLQGNPSLRHLNLSQNLLVDLEPLAFDHLEKLETLDLSSNFLMGLSMQFFQEVERKKRLRMVYLQRNQWKCDKCHIKPLIHFLKNSLMYWGSCFKKDSPLCLKCSNPNHLLHVPIEELTEKSSLPDCIPIVEVHFESTLYQPSKESWDTNSPSVALGVASCLLLIPVIILIVR